MLYILYTVYIIYCIYYIILYYTILYYSILYYILIYYIILYYIMLYNILYYIIYCIYYIILYIILYLCYIRIFIYIYIYLLFYLCLHITSYNHILADSDPHHSWQAGLERTGQVQPAVDSFNSAEADAGISWEIHRWSLLVGGLNPSEKNISQLGLLFPTTGENQTCSKPPTSLLGFSYDQLLSCKNMGETLQIRECPIYSRILFVNTWICCWLNLYYSYFYFGRRALFWLCGFLQQDFDPVVCWCNWYDVAFCTCEVGWGGLGWVGGGW